MNKQKKLESLKKEQEKLNEEIKQLENGTYAEQRCKEVAEFVNKFDKDPMSEDEKVNYFKHRQCFIKGTKILLKSNSRNDEIDNDNDESNNSLLHYKNIENIEIGDIVACYDISSNCNNNNHINNNNSNDDSCYKIDIKNISRNIQNGNVYNSTCNIVFAIEKITLNNNIVIHCTSEHPFFVNNQGWKTVGGDSTCNYNRHEYNIIHDNNLKISKLNIGDELCLSNGELSSIASIEHIYYNDGIEVYNLSVDNCHTFFANDVLVHNKGCCIL